MSRCRFPSIFSTNIFQSLLIWSLRTTSTAHRIILHFSKTHAYWRNYISWSPSFMEKPLLGLINCISFAEEIRTSQIGRNLLMIKCEGCWRNYSWPISILPAETEKKRKSLFGIEYIQAENRNVWLILTIILIKLCLILVNLLQAYLINFSNNVNNVRALSPRN